MIRPRLPGLGQITEAARTIDVVHETDVLVVGGGPGGLAAALGAARQGAQVMLVERYGCFGGVIAQSMVGTIAWYRTSEQTVDAGGIGTEFERRAKDMNASLQVNHYQVLDTEVFKYIADRMIQEAEIVPLLHTQVVDVILEGGSIGGVITESKSGRRAILAKRVIDATGDGDVAARAGAPFRIDPKETLEGDGHLRLQRDRPPVHRPSCAEPQSIGTGRQPEWDSRPARRNRPSSAPICASPSTRPRRPARSRGTCAWRRYWGSFTDAGEIPNLNAIHMAVDRLHRGGPDPGRDRGPPARDGGRLAALMPGFEKARLRTIGASIGCRESRKIIGGYHLSRARRPEPGEVRRLDRDLPGVPGRQRGIALPSTGRYFQVPYRITLPPKVENLLVAGRSWPATRSPTRPRAR